MKHTQTTKYYKAKVYTAFSISNLIKTNKKKRINKQLWKCSIIQHNSTFIYSEEKKKIEAIIEGKEKNNTHINKNKT